MDAAINNGENAALNHNRKALIKDGLLFVLMSTLLYQLGLSVLVFISPLMVFAVKYGKSKTALLMIVELFVITALELVRGGLPDFSDSASLMSFAISIYFPLSLLAAGVTWLYASGVKVTKRLFISMLPIIAISILYIVPFAVDRALFDGLYLLFEDAFATLMEPVMDIIGELDLGSMFYLMFLTILSMILSLMMVAVCASCFVYETSKHSKERDWEDRVRRFCFSSDLIWFLIISWALVLLGHFISMPAFVSVVLLNLALTSIILYSAQGFSVLYAWLSRNRRQLKSMQLFLILAIIVMAIPGINFIIIFGLPIIGILESFFDLKKIGVKNEDYS